MSCLRPLLGLAHNVFMKMCAQIQKTQLALAPLQGLVHGLDGRVQLPQLPDDCLCLGGLNSGARPNCLNCHWNVDSLNSWADMTPSLFAVGGLGSVSVLAASTPGLGRTASADMTPSTPWADMTPSLFAVGGLGKKAHSARSLERKWQRRCAASLTHCIRAKGKGLSRLLERLGLADSTGDVLSDSLKLPPDGVI